MVHAEITLKDGTKMLLDGSPEEIMQIKEKLEDNSKTHVNLAHKDKRSISDKEGPLGRITNLIHEGYFKEKRTISDIKNKLAENAIFYDNTVLSPSLLRLIRKGLLRRIKEEGQWRYVNL